LSFSSRPVKKLVILSAAKNPPHFVFAVVVAVAVAIAVACSLLPGACLEKVRARWLQLQLLLPVLFYAYPKPRHPEQLLTVSS